MIRIFLITLILSSCALHYPKFPGPANKIDCRIFRENSLIGNYTCTVEGEYQLEEADLF